MKKGSPLKFVYQTNKYPLLLKLLTHRVRKREQHSLIQSSICKKYTLSHLETKGVKLKSFLFFQQICIAFRTQCNWNLKLTLAFTHTHTQHAVTNERQTRVKRLLILLLALLFLLLLLLLLHFSFNFLTKGKTKVVVVVAVINLRLNLDSNCLFIVLNFLRQWLKQ